jgi:hypothetical protein
MIADDISLSTMDPNPTIDDFAASNDGGAYDVGTANSASEAWGTVIGSLVTGATAIATAPVAPQIYPQPLPTYSPAMSSNAKMLLLVMVAILIGFFVWSQNQ